MIGTIEFYKELQKLNLQPVNQLALNHLRRAKQQPDPERMAILQLVEWGLDNGQVKVRSKVVNQRDLVDLVEKLTFLEPKQQEKLLLVDGPDQGVPWVDVQDLRRARNPKEAAQYLANSITDLIIENLR